MRNNDSHTKQHRGSTPPLAEREDGFDERSGKPCLPPTREEHRLTIPGASGKRNLDAAPDKEARIGGARKYDLRDNQED